MAFDFLQDFGKAFVPKKVRPHLRVYLEKAGVSSSPYKFFGALFYVTLLLTLLLYMLGVWSWVQGRNPVVIFVVSLGAWAAIQLVLVAMVVLLVYFFLDLRIYQRTQIMDAVLADYLSLVSSNLKGGMGLEHAMFSAIKPRFGPLADEMTLVSKKMMTGHDMADALGEFAERYDSATIRRTMNLIVGEIDTGGKIAYIIDQIVSNLKRTQKLKAEMAASVVSYMIFIAAIVVVIAPLLFALSYHLLTFISEFTMRLAESGGAGTVNMPFSFSADGLNTDAFRMFSYAALITISLFASMIVSIIEKGAIRSGLKYIPVFLIGSLVVYGVATAILGAVFGNIMVGL